MRDGLTVDKWMLLAVVGLLAVGVTMVLSTAISIRKNAMATALIFFANK
jgi:hypothetical protein